jgi:hypothetical protein
MRYHDHNSQFRRVDPEAGGKPLKASRQPRSFLTAQYGATDREPTPVTS